MKILKTEGRRNLCGERIRGSRKARIPAITQKKLAERLELEGVLLDRMAINRIEAGHRFVADFELVAIAHVLGVSVNWLLFGQDHEI